MIYTFLSLVPTNIAVNGILQERPNVILINALSKEEAIKKAEETALSLMGVPKNTSTTTTKSYNNILVAETSEIDFLNALSIQKISLIDNTKAPKDNSLYLLKYLKDKHGDLKISTIINKLKKPN